MVGSQEAHLLSLVMDGLDDLYDQRNGGPVGGERVTRAEVWLVRLFTASGLALQDSVWRSPLLGAAHELQALMRSGVRGEELNDSALDLTDDLRLAIAAAL